MAELESNTLNAYKENIIGNKRNGNNLSKDYEKVIQEKKLKVNIYKNPELVELVTGIEAEKLESKYFQLSNWIDTSDEKKYLDCEFTDSNYSVINLSKDKISKDFNASFTWNCPCDYEYFVLVTSSFSSTGAIQESTRCAQHAISSVCKFFPQIALHNIPKNYLESEELIDMELILIKLMDFVNSSCKMNFKLLQNSEASLCVSVICKSDNLMTTINIGNTNCMVIGKDLAGTGGFVNKFETSTDNYRLGKSKNIVCKPEQILLSPDDTLIQFSNKFLLAPTLKNNKPFLSYQRNKQNIVYSIEKYYKSNKSISLASYLADSFIDETVNMCKLLQVKIHGVSNMYRYLLSWISYVSVQTYNVTNSSNDSDIFDDYDDSNDFHF
jgi:hypothetical protein